MARKKRKTSLRDTLRPTRALIRRLLARLKSGGDLRTTKVRRLRAAVRARRYENDLKAAIAADRLLGELEAK